MKKSGFHMKGKSWKKALTCLNKPLGTKFITCNPNSFESKAEKKQRIILKN